MRYAQLIWAIGQALAAVLGGWLLGYLLIEAAAYAMGAI